MIEDYVLLGYFGSLAWLSWIEDLVNHLDVWLFWMMGLKMETMLLWMI